MPPIFSRGNNALVPIDSVLRVIEVKSTLNPDGLRQLEKAAACFNVNNPNAMKIVNHRDGDIERPNYPFLSALAYTSSAKKCDEFKRLKQYAPVNHEVIKCLTVVDKGAWSTSSPVYLSDKPAENVRKYLVYLLDELETDASTRSKFQISKWLR